MMSLKRLKKDFCDEVPTIIISGHDNCENLYEKHILR